MFTFFKVGNRQNVKQKTKLNFVHFVNRLFLPGNKREFGRNLDEQATNEQDFKIRKNI